MNRVDAFIFGFASAVVIGLFLFLFLIESMNTNAVTRCRAEGHTSGRADAWRGIVCTDTKETSLVLEPK